MAVIAHNEHQDANGKPKRPQGTESDTEMDSDIDLYREQWDVEAHAAVPPLNDRHHLTIVPVFR